MVVVDYLGPEVGHQEEVSTNSHTVQETPKVDRGTILGGGVGNNTTGLVWSGLVWIFHQVRKRKRVCEVCSAEVLDIKKHMVVHTPSINPLRCTAEGCNHVVKSGRNTDLKRHMDSTSCRRWVIKQTRETAPVLTLDIMGEVVLLNSFLLP